MNLTSAAIEAAAKALCRVNGNDRTSEWWVENYRYDVRAALEAATPYLMAQALNDAADAVDGGGSISAWLRDRAASYHAEATAEYTYPIEWPDMPRTPSARAS